MLIKSLLPSLTSSPTTTQAFGAAGQAMAELFTAGCIGSTCVKKDYLNANIVQSLSKTCFSILLPMFLSTSIMTTVEKYGLTKSSLAIPLVAITHCMTLYMISRHVLLPIFGIDDESVEGRATNVCCAFGNSGVVPMIFAEALFRNAGGDVLQKAYSQVSLYLIGWSPVFWSFGRNALLGGLVNKSSSDYKEQQLTLMERLESLKSLFPPPVLGVFFGLVLSSIPFLRCLVMDCSPEGAKKKAPLGVLFNSCQNLGRAANPLALLVLTSSLALGNSNSKLAAMDDQHHEEIPLIRRWTCVSIARFAVSPILMISLLKLVHGFGIIGSTTSDPMLWFILILQASMPPAQNSVIMLQVAEKTKEASSLARFLFVMYATAMIPVVIVATILLEKCNLTV